MDSLPKPEVIITHESDLDGFVAGLLLRRLAKHQFGVEVPLQAYHNDGWQKRVLSERSAWVTDLSFTQRLDKHDWVIVDHHSLTEGEAKTAILYHDPRKSASLLCYELCQKAGLGSPALDRLVHLSNVADLFIKEDPDFILATDYANLVKTYQFWNLYALVDGDPERLLDHPLLEVMTVKRRVEDPIGLGWSRKNIVEISPTVGFVDILIGNANMIIHELLSQQATRYAVLLTMFRKNNGGVVVSLRSANGEAVKVAERFLGGGHPNAAGATLPRSVSTIADAIEYMRNILNPRVDLTPPANINSLESAFINLELKP